MKKKIFVLSISMLVVVGALTINPLKSYGRNVTEPEEGEPCPNPNTENTYGDKVHYSNKANYLFRAGCFKECDAVCVIEL